MFHTVLDPNENEVEHRSTCEDVECTYDCLIDTYWLITWESSSLDDDLLDINFRANEFLEKHNSLMNVINFIRENQLILCSTLIKSQFGKAYNPLGEIIENRVENDPITMEIYPSARYFVIVRDGDSINIKNDSVGNIFGADYKELNEELCCALPVDPKLVRDNPQLFMEDCGFTILPDENMLEFVKLFDVYISLKEKYLHCNLKLHPPDYTKLNYKYGLQVYEKLMNCNLNRLIDYYLIPENPRTDILKLMILDYYSDDSIQENNA